MLLRVMSCGAAVLIAFAVVPLASAENVTPAPTDCGYPSTETTRSSAPAKQARGIAFPQDDVFRSLTADPKQPQFITSYQRIRYREVNQSINAGVVAFGETFGLYGHRDGNCNGLQVGIQGGVFAQFNLDAPSKDLINADYVVGLPVTWRQGPFSARVRLYHQSSHLGDDFLLDNPGINRIDFRFEEVEGLMSVDLAWLRLYGGGGYLLHREPAIQRGKVQWGLELRPPDRASPFLQDVIEDLHMAPIMAADFKTLEEQGWNVNANVVAGLEWYRPGSTRRLRALLSYYHGFNPYGQFFNQKIEMVGIGLYFHF